MKESDVNRKSNSSITGNQSPIQKGSQLPTKYLKDNQSKGTHKSPRGALTGLHAGGNRPKNDYLLRMDGGRLTNKNTTHKEKGLIRVTITVPQRKRDLWKIFISEDGKGGSPKRKSKASLIYSHLERKFFELLASQRNKEICVKVDYGDGYHNESIDSSDIKYQLYATACFLEDHLSEEFLKTRYRRYQP